MNIVIYTFEDAKKFEEKTITEAVIDNKLNTSYIILYLYKMNIHRANFVLEDINYLPEDVVDYVIKEYIPDEYFMLTNKHYYLLYHSTIRHKIRNYENFIRDMIKRDNDFVFRLMLQENYKRWMDIRQYIYKSTLYKNYIYFVNDFCIEHDSNKCRTTLMGFLDEHGLCQNQHKKNIRRSIKWKS